MGQGNSKRNIIILALLILLVIIIPVSFKNRNKSEEDKMRAELKKYGLKLENIGDTVYYKPDSVTLGSDAKIFKDLEEYSGSNENTTTTLFQENLKWRILDVKDGHLRLISSKPTESKIGFRGSEGYNNGVYLLDEACSALYSSSVGTAKNLKIEDIEDKLAYDYTQYKNNSVSTGKYGGTKEYLANNNDNLRYPNIYAQEEGCLSTDGGEKLKLSEQTAPVKGTSVASDKLKVTQTYWGKLLTTEDFRNPVYENIFVKDGEGGFYETYWLSSRATNCISDYPYFYIRNVYSGGVVSRFNLYYYYKHDTNNRAWSLRPVITLSKDIKLTGNTTRGWYIE